MKFITAWRRKFCNRGASFALIAVVLAAVLLLNVAATALFSGLLWYIDLSPESYYNVYVGDTEEKAGTMYTLMPETVHAAEYIIEEANKKRPENDPVKVDIIFCAEPDQLKRMDMMRYVYYTALNLQKKFSDTIRVSYRDVWSNPSSVDEYRSTSYSTIFQTDVIIASGTEFRVCPMDGFYGYDSESGDMSTPVWYNGQKIFVKHILDVTGAAAPICCLTINHGEPFATWDLADRENWPEYREFMKVIEGAGYEIRFLDLSREEIPEDCRLIITFDPQTDFVSPDAAHSDVSQEETVRLDAFLEKAYSYMVFLDADTPKLPNLEEYLEFWGISFMRAEGVNAGGQTVTGNYQVADPANGLSSEGLSFAAQYVKGSGLGNAVLHDIIASATSPKIYFDNAMPIAYASGYTKQYVQGDASKGTESYTFGSYEKNHKTRTIFDMFEAGSKQNLATYRLVNNGEVLKNEAGVDIGGSDIFRLMTISRESRPVQEGNYQGLTVNQSSYVCAVGSTSFATDAVLGTFAYGNTDALLATLRYIGKEVNPVHLSLLELYSARMDESLYLLEDSTTGATSVLPGIAATAVIFAIIPAITMTVTGTVVLVKRRIRH